MQHRYSTVTLELSSYALEVSNDGFTALEQNMIGFSTLSQEES